MNVIDNEQVYMFDCDDTLVMWNENFYSPGEGRKRIVDPYDGGAVYLTPNDRHIKLLKSMAGRGRHIVVWSAAGVQWAKAIVDALGLKEYVNTVMTKPLGHVDDLPCTEWMGKRIYLGRDKDE
jgi:phosphoserine phosphatase